MRKWRPSFKCIYILPDIVGYVDRLEIILNRVLPLRIFKGQEDQIVFLGNYIGMGVGSANVIDVVINVKKEYGDRAILLRGKNEELFLRALFGGDSDFNYWMQYGFGAGIIQSYLAKSNSNVNPNSIQRNRLQDLIPPDHIEFLKSLEYMHVIDNFAFLHGSFDHNKPLKDNSYNNLIFDTTAARYISECVRNSITPQFKDDYTFICNTNVSKKPFIHQRYMMLGNTAPDRSLVVELNSMEICAVSAGKSRIYPYNFKVLE